MEDLTNLLERDIPSLRRGNYSNATEFCKAIYEKNGWHLKEAVVAEKWLDALDLQCDLAENNPIVMKALCEKFEKSPEQNERDFQISLKNQVSDLLKTITSKKKALETPQQPVNPANFHYIPVQTEDLDVLEFYEGIGEQIRGYRSAGSSTVLDSRYAILEEMPKIAFNISEFIKRNPDEHAPSFIVCNSSGTGKTQIPFTLEIPLLFFSISNFNQSIYRLFQKISRHLIILLNHDFQTFEYWLEKNKKYEGDSDGLYSMRNFCTKNIRECNAFKTPSFLLGLVQQIIGLKEAYPQHSWPKLQLKLQNAIQVQDLTFELFGQARDKLLGKKDPKSDSNFEEQFPVLPQLPLIFLDEFNLDPTNESKAKYAFYRNIIRCCGLIPVLMGTNSKISNLITSARGSGEESFIWSHVFYKLPPYPLKLLRLKLDQLQGKLGLTSANGSLVELLVELLQKERPFFVSSVVERLLDEKQEGFKDLDALFEFIFHAIDDDFTERKIGFLEHYYLHQYLFMEFALMKVFKLKQHQHYLNSVNVHLAHLVPPINCFNISLENPREFKKAEDCSYFEIYHTLHQARYKSKDVTRGELVNYVPDCIFDFFYDVPLSAMALAWKDPFKKGNCFITAFETMVKSREPNMRTGQGIFLQKSLDSSFLEHIVNLAFLVASYQGGIKGINFKDWFKYFVQQLACSKFESKTKVLKEINFPNSFPLNDYNMPIVAFNYSEWNPILREFFTANNIELGVFTGARYKSTDLLASRSAQDGFFSPLLIENTFVKKDSTSDEYSSEPMVVEFKRRKINRSARITSNPQNESSIEEKNPQDESLIEEKERYESYPSFISQAKQLENMESSYISIECKYQKEAFSIHSALGFALHMIENECDSYVNLIVMHDVDDNPKTHSSAHLNDERFSDSSIYILKRGMDNEKAKGISDDCAYLNCQNFLLSPLKEVKNSRISKVFILISLTEIHGGHLWTHEIQHTHK